LPRRHKLRGLSLKRVLKHSQRDRLPASILHRSKRGFGVPLDRWFRTDLRAFTQSMLSAPSSRLHSYVRPEAVGALIDEHLSGRADNGNALWTLLTLEVFLRSVDS
jgi:asparagine synthase (glutamine-hydrolysing)